MEYYDALETRSPEQREAELLKALPGQIAHAKRNAPGFARILAAVDPAAVTSRAALARLPVTRKSDLGELQKGMPPLGGLNAAPRENWCLVCRIPHPVCNSFCQVGISRTKHHTPETRLSIKPA